MSMDLNKGAFAQLGPMYDQLLSMTPDQIMQAGAPEFLKIAAMQQQGKARQAMQAPTPPSSTVAQDVVRSVTPTGIGALPTSPAPIASGPTLAAAPAPTAQMASGGLVDLETSPDMFNDRYYSDGGIVAFANGGEATKQYQAEQDRAAKERADFFRVGTKLPRDPVKEQLIAQTKPGPNRELLIARYRQDTGIDLSPYQLVRSAELKKDINDPELSSEEFASTYIGPARKKGSIVEGEITEPTASAEPAEQDTQSDYSQFLKQMGGAGEIPAVAGIAGLGAEPSMPPLKFAPEEKSITAEEAIAEKNRALAAAGVDREAERARRREKLDEKSAEYSESKRKAPWEALIDAGLNIAAGTSQNALENIAKGAQQGFAAYKETSKELKQDKNILDELESKTAEAEYAERLGDAEYANQRVREVELRKLDASNKRIDIINARGLAEFQVKSERHENQLNRIQQANLANAQIRAQALTNAAKMAMELKMTREKLASDYKIATLGLQSSTLKAFATSSGKGAMTQKQYFDVMQILKQDPGVLAKVELWKESHADASPEKIEGYKLTLADETYKAIMSTQAAMDSTSSALEQVISFVNNNSSGISGFGLERVGE